MSTVPLHLPGETMTLLIQDRVKTWIKKYPQMRELVFPDEVYPGTLAQSKTQMGLRMLMQTYPEDYSLLANPNYMDYYLQGLMTQTPMSPYWANLMASKDMFKSHQQTFLDFLQRRAWYRQSKQLLGPEIR